MGSTPIKGITIARMTSTATPDDHDAPAWRLAWLDRVGPFSVLLALLFVGFVLHLLYLLNDCPIDLTGDEAHYWDWSRELDIAYYSKGPLVAWIIRASCAVFGDVMWAVRLPALLFAVGTSLLTYWLVNKLFGSSRLALGAVALNHTVPLFVAGSLIMTIDPPFFFCWAATTCLAAIALFDGRRWAWVSLGLTAGIGLLAKYAMPLWYVGLFAFLFVDRPSRRWLRTPWLYAALGLTLLFFAAPVWWNWKHDWVTFRHVGRQTGVTATEGAWYLNPPTMLLTQFLIVGPILASFILLAARATLRGRVAERPIDVEERRRVRFLLCVALGFFACIFVASFRAEIEPNWPAPIFFTLPPLAAWWLGKRLTSVRFWKPVRGFFWAHVTMGLIVTTLAHQTHLLYPIAAHFGWKPKRVDLAQVIKARGNAEFGNAVSEQLAKHPGAFVVARQYQDASELGFYVAGQPKVYDIGSRMLSEKERSRHSQFDVWKSRDIDDPALLGRDAIFFGTLDPDGVVKHAFDRIELVDTVRIVRGGLELRSRTIYIGYGFRGVPRRDAGGY